MSLDQTHFDAILIGTGLPQSILSASLSQSHLSVLHIDEASYYGGSYASLSLSELCHWVKQRGGGHASLSFPAYSKGEEGDGDLQLPPDLRKLDRHYSLSLSPSLVPSLGPTIDVLISSTVSSYCTFRLLERTLVVTTPSSSSSGHSKPKLSKVPSSKQDIFKDQRLTLVEKRKLMKMLLDMRPSGKEGSEGDEGGEGKGKGKDGEQDLLKPFLTYLSERYNLSPSLAESIAYGVALCSGKDDPTGPALQRVQRHLEGIGRYGNSAYLIGQYGGAGEVAQSYCRASAVHGGTFILGHEVQRLEREVGEIGAGRPNTFTSASLPTTDEASEDPKQGQTQAAQPTTTTQAQRWAVRLEGVEEELTSDWLVADEDFLIARGLIKETDGEGEGRGESDEGEEQRRISGILVLDRPLTLDQDIDDARSQSVAPTASSLRGGEGSDEARGKEEETPETALIVFPPFYTAGEEAKREGLPNTVTALVMGEGTFSCPKGQYVVYLNTHVSSSSTSGTETEMRSPREVLEPYRRAILSLAGPCAIPSSATGEDGSAASEGEKEATGPRQPLIECYFSQSATSGLRERRKKEVRERGSDFVVDEGRKLLSVPFPPGPPSSSNTSSSSKTSSRPAPLPSLLPTLLDTSTALAEDLFWSIQGPEARRRYEDVKKRRREGSRRREPAEYLGRAGAEDSEGEERRRERERREEEESGFIRFFGHAGEGRGEGQD